MGAFKDISLGSVASEKPIRRRGAGDDQPFGSKPSRAWPAGVYFTSRRREVKTDENILASEEDTPLDIYVGKTLTSRRRAMRVTGDAAIVFDALPTADPGVAGALWIDVAAGRVIKSSAG